MVDFEPEVLRTDLTRIVQDIFQTMLGMEAQARDLRIEDLRPPIVSASMHLSGNWNGAVLLQCELPAAAEFTSAMLGMEKPATAGEDLKDVMGEVINMIAGNFKGLIGGAHLSMPIVVEGSDYRIRLLGGKPTARLGFLTPGGPLHLTLVELEVTAGP